MFEWQEKAVKAFNDNQCKGIMQAATGTGKTRVAVTIMNELREKTLIIVPTINLSKQWKGELMKFGVPKEKIGFVSSGIREVKPVTISVINSIRNREVKGFDLLVVDEVHRIGAPQSLRFLERNKHNFKHFLGLTPILKRLDDQHKIVEEIFGGVVYDYGYTDAVEDEVVCQYHLVNCGVELGDFNRVEYNRLSVEIGSLLSEFGDLPTALKKIHNSRARILFSKIQERKKLVYNCWEKLERAVGVVLENRFRRVIVFCEVIDMAERLKEELEKREVNCGVYHSQNNLQEMLDAFGSNAFNVLLCVKSLDEGYNVPDIDVGIVVNGNSTKRQAIQRLGRILRKKEGTATLYQLYCMNTMEEKYLRTRSSGITKGSMSVEWR
jgi:superfamily II DNA or RNA helicase